jgi:hypothetical protein
MKFAFKIDQVDKFIYFAGYIREWTNTILKTANRQRKLGYSDEDIGIILSITKDFPGRYILLFQRLNQIFSGTKIAVQFDFESLSQEKPVVIICG